MNMMNVLFFAVSVFCQFSAKASNQFESVNEIDNEHIIQNAEMLNLDKNTENQELAKMLEQLIDTANKQAVQGQKIWAFEEINDMLSIIFSLTKSGVTKIDWDYVATSIGKGLAGFEVQEKYNIIMYGKNNKKKKIK